MKRHTGRSLRDESNRRTTNVGAIHESPAINHRFAGKAETTANETYSSNPYGSPVKIVGDNVTKKDYDDFWNAFHEESTGEKLNWAANIAKPQNTARRQYVTDKDVKTINTEMDADKVYEDDFWGQVGANYYEGSFELEEKQAWDKYNKNPTLENKRIAEDISAALNNFRQRNSEVLENDITPAWIVREFAGELPEIIDGVEDGIRQKDLGLIQDAFSDNMDEIIDKAKDIHYSRNQYNVNLPENINEAEKMGWRDDVPVDCHNFTAPKRDNVKFVHSDGREAIFDASGMHSVTSDEDMPTFNFYNPKDEPIRHGVTDVFPWFLWGNTPNDTTNHFERALTAIPIYYKVH